MVNRIDITQIEHVPRPDYVWPIADCIDWMQSMLVQIRQDVSTSDIDQVSDYMEMLRAEYSSASMVQASMEWYYKIFYREVYNEIWRKYKRAAQAGAIPRELQELNGKKAFADYIESHCADVKVLLTLAERLHSSITHSVDVLRTNISKEKEFMKMQQFGGGHGRPDPGDQTLNGRQPSRAGAPSGNLHRDERDLSGLDLDFERCEKAEASQVGGDSYFPDESSPYANR